MGYTWGLWDQNVIKKIKGFTILSVAYKWLGKPTQVIACDKQSEKSLLIQLRHILNEADVVVAHNGDSFDIKKINARFIIHKMSPPKPYRTVDTKKVAKSVAAFDSNSLENLGIDMGEGEKIKHRGFAMWEGVMAGNKRDWADMKKYNKRDVDLLERVYIRLLPWIKNHPNHSLYLGKPACPNCGGTVQSRGIKGQMRQFQCNTCRKWSRSPKSLYKPAIVG